MGLSNESEQHEQEKKINSYPPDYDPFARYQTVATQTTSYNCPSCEERTRYTFVDVETQCDPKNTVDSSSQTADHSLSPLKSKSLSQMTPAQILAELNRKEVERKTEVSSMISESASSGKRELSLKTQERTVELDYEERDERPKRAGFTPRKNAQWEGRMGASSGQWGYKGAAGGFKRQLQGDNNEDDDEDVRGEDIFGPKYDEEDQDDKFKRDHKQFNSAGSSSQNRPFCKPSEKKKYRRL